MLYFFTTLAIGHLPPLDWYCLLIDQTCGQAFIPPSTVRFDPVMYEDSGPAMNATAAAISSTRPWRSSAVAAFSGDESDLAFELFGIVFSGVADLQRTFHLRCSFSSCSAIQEQRDVLNKQLGILKLRPMIGVGVDD